MKIAKIENGTSFKRKPTASEMVIYTQSINKGMKLLGKDLGIILHNSSAPAQRAENYGIGSLLSTTVKEKLLPFLKSHGFSTIQQEPNFMRKNGIFSPYSPASTAKNEYLIPLEKLITKEYGNILSQDTFNMITKNIPSDRSVDFSGIKEKYNLALEEAYKNFNKSEASPIKKEFSDFKKLNALNFESSSLFYVLSDIYKTDDWKTWSGIDKTLLVNSKSKVAKERISELKKDYAEKIDFFLFKQMIIEREIKSCNENARKQGIKLMGDSPVAFSAEEEWAYQNLFLKNKALGCPPDYFSKDGQRWGFNYFDPKYIFNEDGSLGKAGEILYKKYFDFFKSYPGGIRIDHIIGLIDPFVYSTKSPKMTKKNSGRLYSIINKDSKKHDYSQLMRKIIIKAANDAGVNKSSIICEDLGEVTKPVKKVMKDLELGGISVTQFDYRGKNASPKNTIMIGSHDNPSFLEYIDGLFAEQDKIHFNKKTSLLPKETSSKSMNKAERKQNHFNKKTSLLAKDTSSKSMNKAEIKEYLKEIRNDKSKFLLASFVELFTSPAKRVQIFFTDFFGIAETYNKPGTVDGNWKLRLGEDFEKQYYENVSLGKAPNIADVVLRAIKQNGLDKRNKKLVEDLDASAKILYEKV